jgi:hypothetical protein
MNELPISAQSNSKGAPLTVRVCTAQETKWFDTQMGQHHYLGAGRPVGDYLAGANSTKSHYYLSSLLPKHHRPRQWLGSIRDHWAGAEVRNHWRQDALMGEPLSRGFAAASARTTRAPPRPMLYPPLLTIASKQKTLPCGLARRFSSVVGWLGGPWLPTGNRETAGPARNPPPGTQSVERDAAAEVSWSVQVFASANGRLTLVEAALGNDLQRQPALA